MFESESEALKNGLEVDSKGLDSILSRIEKDINHKINDTNNKMSLYNDKKAKESKPNTFQELDSILMKPITNNIENILKSINFPDLEGVTFSDKSRDFIINNKDRQSFGKGFRAITYSVFIIIYLIVLLSNKLLLLKIHHLLVIVKYMKLSLLRIKH